MDGNSMPSTTDGDGMPDTTNMMDANVFEIITQTSTFPELTLLNPEQILLAESELPPEDSSIPPKLSTTDAHPLLVIEHFPYGSSRAPINGTQGSSIYNVELGGCSI
jgi:hypothetical protein